jgi:3-hydroxypropionyl-coenzyme A dehydratase
MKLVEEIQQSAPLAVGMAKRVIDGLADTGRGMFIEGWAQSQLIQTEDFAEAIQSFVTKKKPDFKGR